MAFPPVALRVVVMGIGVGAVLAASSCKQNKQEEAKQDDRQAPASSENPVPVVFDAGAPPALRPLEADGVALFQNNAIVEPQAVWTVKQEQVVFAATAVDHDGKPGAKIVWSRGEETGDVVACSSAEFSDALSINGYLESTETVFVVCESPHSKDKPGVSRGVRLLWNGGAPALSGSFENEGPPAYDTMDFDEEE